MIIDDIDYDDENEWRVARVVSVRIIGEEHRIQTQHHGGMVRNHYVCQDCKSVYFDEHSDVRESPVVVHGVVQIDEKFVDKIAELAVSYGDDLPALDRFLRWIVKTYGVVIDMPSLEDLRSDQFLEEEEK